MIKKEQQEEVYRFLNELRESGKTNMFEATSYLVLEFGFNTKEARKWLSNWMKDF